MSNKLQISTVLGNGGSFYFSVSQNPQIFLNSAGRGTGVFQSAAGGHAHDCAVSTILKVQLSLCAPCRHAREIEVQLNSFLNSVLDRDE